MSKNQETKTGFEVETETQEPRKEMPLELVVGGTVPVITSNFETLKDAIKTRLKLYEIAVTEENLAQAKRDATDLGKAATQLNKLCKEKAKEFAMPIEDFKVKILELVGLIQDGQMKIKQQVEVYEAKTRKLCEEKMNAYLLAQYEQREVKPLYRSSTITALVGISRVDKKGELTKAAREAIESLVISDRSRQDRTELRLNELKVKSIEAGLKLAIQASAVWEFIHETDEEYSRKLECVIKAELLRQVSLLNAEKARMEKEAQVKADIEAKVKAEAEAKIKIEALQKEYEEKRLKEQEEYHRKALEEAERIKKEAIDEAKKGYPIGFEKTIKKKAEEVSRINVSSELQQIKPYTVWVSFPVLNPSKPLDEAKVMAFFSAELGKTRLPSYKIEIK